MRTHEQIETRIEQIFLVVFRALLVISIIGNIFTQNWVNLYTAVLTLILTWLPFIIADRSHLNIPPLFHLVLLVFIFASMYLGELQEYYLIYWWWDLVLHGTSGVIFGFIGLVMVYILNNKPGISVMLSPLFVALFSFTFAIAVGVIWEIFEYTMDQLLKINMQKSGIDDTMWDLLVDALGALLAAWVGYHYLSGERRTVFSRIAKRIIAKQAGAA